MSDSSSDEVEFEGDDNDDDVEESEDEEDKEGEGDEDEDEDEEDVPLASLKKKRRASKVASYAEDDDGDGDEDDDDDDDDDDVPLASLAKKKKQEPKKKEKAKPKKSSSIRSAPSEKSMTLQRKDSSTSNTSSKKYEWRSAALYGTECDKGMLIQRILCRWWYAITWPDPKTLPDSPPKHYDALDGFPGVYVGTEGEHVGEILDLRDKDEAPSFQNFSKKSSDELRDLLLKALKEQKKQLIEAEGNGTETEREIDRLIKWATKVNTTKADKDAVKVLKASGFKV